MTAWDNEKVNHEAMDTVAILVILILNAVIGVRHLVAGTGGGGGGKDLDQARVALYTAGIGLRKAAAYFEVKRDRLIGAPDRKSLEHGLPRLSILQVEIISLTLLSTDRPACQALVSLPVSARCCGRHDAFVVMESSRWQN